MVSCDSCVQISPESLNRIVLRTVGRQEVALDLSPFGPDCLLRDLTGVNAVIIDNEMNELVGLELITEFVH